MCEVGITFDRTKPFDGIQLVDEAGNTVKIKDLSLLNPFDTTYYTTQNIEQK